MEIKKNFQKHKRSGIKFPKQGKTHGEFKDECDINSIMSKFNKTGQLPELIKKNPQYGDFANVSDYQTSLNTVMHAQQQFEALPANIRKRFDNDPASFLEFCSNEENVDELRELGCLPKLKKPTEDPPKVKTEPKAPTKKEKPVKGD